MFSQLIKITEREMADRAAEAGWCVDALAAGCGVSVSTLERFFHETKGRCPREWMTAERMRRARMLLERGDWISTIAEVLCYRHQRNFATAFTAFHGYPPREHRPGKWKEDGIPQSAVRSPQSAVRSPQSAVRSPQSATMMPGDESVFDKIKPNLAWL